MHRGVLLPRRTESSNRATKYCKVLPSKESDSRRSQSPESRGTGDVACRLCCGCCKSLDFHVGGLHLHLHETFPKNLPILYHTLIKVLKHLVGHLKGP